jgi:uncharacterized membrane protein HdeD (DUF308 family)
MANLTISSPATEQRRRWIWFLALGVVLLLLGLASAGATTLLQLTSFLVFGPMLLASSVIQLVTAFVAEKGAVRFLHYGAAGLEAILGFLILAYPLFVVTDLVLVIAAFLMVIGLLRLTRSLVTDSPGRRWIFMAGGAALVLGICVWLKLPVSGLWVVGLCIALDFICHGFSWSAVALAERKPLDPLASSELQGDGSR